MMFNALRPRVTKMLPVMALLVDLACEKRLDEQWYDRTRQDFKFPDVAPIARMLYIALLSVPLFASQDAASIPSALLLPLEAASQHPALLRRHASVLCLHVLPHVARLYRQLSDGAPGLHHRTTGTQGGTQGAVKSLAGGEEEGQGRKGAEGQLMAGEALAAFEDTRFMCAKTLCDGLPLLLLPPCRPSTAAGRCLAVDDADEREREEEASETRQLVTELLHHHVLPLFSHLLSDMEPVPAYAEKMLVGLLDQGVVSMEDMASSGIAQRCFQRVSSDPSLVSMHTLRLILLLVTHPDMAPHARQQLHLLPRVAALLANVCAAEMHEYVDPVVSLCLLLLELAVGQEGGPAPQGRGTCNGHSRAGEHARASGGLGDGEVGVEVEAVVQHTGVFLHLCGHHDPVVADIAADCLALMLAALPWQVARTLLPALGVVPDILKPERRMDTPPELQEKIDFLVLRVVVSAAEVACELLTGQGVMRQTSLDELPKEVISSLMVAVSRKATSRDLDVASSANKAEVALAKCLGLYA